MQGKAKQGRKERRPLRRKGGRKEGWKSWWRAGSEERMKERVKGEKIVSTLRLIQLLFILHILFMKLYTL